jgi:hypothetical protein
MPLKIKSHQPEIELHTLYSKNKVIHLEENGKMIKT